MAASAASSSVIVDTTGSFEGMHYKIDHRDSNSILSMRLQPNYQVKGKPGSMVAMEATVQIQGKVSSIYPSFGRHRG